MPMPPNMPISKSATMKTERTHEENQERAYIAASRRSDRSLEARVESARRASEIHKRRTGRALRVTEQDVLNEEMYEEEEDDLPLPYRQLTQHLTTGSAEFNRRLAAYLTNHVAVRSALDQIIRDSHTLSANAAATGNVGFPMGGDYSSMHQTAFSPATYAPSSFNPSIPYTPDQSNPPTPSTMSQQQHHPQPQINMSQLQTQGTQFHIGPLGLSTVPQPNYSAAYARRQTAPQLQIPHSVNQNVYQAFSPQQLHALSHGPPGQQSDKESIKSPRSDSAIYSPQTAPGPLTPSTSSVSSPKMLHTRRMSMPTKVSASPVQLSRSHLPASVQSSSLAVGSTSTPSATKPKKVSTQSRKDGKPSLKVKPPSQSPVLKRKASGDLGQEQTPKSAKQADGRMNTKTSPSNLDLGPLDLSLSQNAQELLYGGMNMTSMPMMNGMNAFQTDSKSAKLDAHMSKGKPFAPTGSQMIATPPLGKFGDGLQGGMAYFGNMQPFSNFTDGEYDLSSLMMETGGNTFGTSFSKLDNMENGNVDELWQDFFASDNFNKASQESTSSQLNNDVETS